MNTDAQPSELSARDRAFYEWQLDVPGFGEAGQLALRQTTALVSRAGGLGGPLAFQLAAAGFGRIIIAHGGDLKPSDLNRQVLMRHDHLGSPRVGCIVETLAAFNPHVAVEAVPSNINEDNAAELVGRADIVFDCAPLFEERFLMNRECIGQGKLLVDAAMYSMEGQVIPIVPGRTACLACVYPEVPPHWRRRFPVIGAVSALVANIAVIEGIKLLTDLPGAHPGTMIYIDTTTMQMNHIHIGPRAGCAVCGGAPAAGA
jgi:molybdopterin/thiamine biosynthesis adenylyltransferase